MKAAGEAAGTRFTAFTSRDGLANESVVSLVFAGDGGLWIGTEQGSSPSAASWAPSRKTSPARLLEGRIREAGAEIELAADLPVVSCDRSRLLQVFQNLIENAVKFMGEQPRPRIRVGCRRRQGEPVLFVEDNGIGIDAADQERVFGLFDRLRRTAEGTGVGLALVKKIVEVHGGRVWIESTGQGHGTRVCFTLPEPPADAG